MANNKFKGFMNMSAFISIALIGITLLLNIIFKTTGGIIAAIGNCLAYVITAVVAWYYVRNKKKTWVYIVYFLALALVIGTTAYTLISSIRGLIG